MPSPTSVGRHLPWGGQVSSESLTGHLIDIASIKRETLDSSWLVESAKCMDIDINTWPHTQSHTSHMRAGPRDLDSDSESSSRDNPMTHDFTCLGSLLRQVLGLKDR